MSTLLTFICWCLLAVLCWPIALLTLLLFPIVWLISLPFRLAFVVTEACFALIKALLFLPVRLIGYRCKS